MKLYSESMAPVKRTKPNELFLVCILAKPSPGNPEAAEVGGAYVNCWVDTDDLRDAEAQAIEAIEAEKWQPTKFDRWQLVNRRFYVDSANYDEAERKELLEVVDEAFEQGLAFEFNCWPPEGAEPAEE